jgi:hypothetical protein
VQQQLDPRIVQVSIEVNGQLKTYQGLDMLITGTKFANANQNECEVKITNLDKQTRDYILTETSPFNLNRTPKLLTVNAGRISYGTTRIFTGNIISAVPSQPPDIALTLKCLTSNYSKGNIVARNQISSSSLSRIAGQVASDLGVALDFQAKDKQIANYQYSGPVLKQVDKLEELGNINAYIDNDVLYVKDKNAALKNRIKIINIDTGMIGIPEITEQGIKVKFLLDNQTALGGALQVQSIMYPAVNGNYIIYKLGFEIASRDTPFYWIAEAKRQ